MSQGYSNGSWNQGKYGVWSYEDCEASTTASSSSTSAATVIRNAIVVISASSVFAATGDRISSRTASTTATSSFTASGAVIPMPTRLLLRLLQLQQALRKSPLALLRLVRRAVRRLLQTLPSLRLQTSRLLHLSQLLVESLTARAHQLQPFQRFQQTVKSNGRKNLLLRRHIQTSLRPAQAGSRRHED